jgi:proline racemase
VASSTQVGPFEAVVPEITGRAYLAGFGQLVLRPDDPFPAGFLL